VQNTSHFVFSEYRVLRNFPYCSCFCNINDRTPMELLDDRRVYVALDRDTVVDETVGIVLMIVSRRPDSLTLCDSSKKK